MLRQFLIAFWLLLTFSGCNFSKQKLTVAPVFSDQMVLQQEQSNPIWGNASPHSQITLKSSWGEVVSVQTDQERVLDASTTHTKV